MRTLNWKTFFEKALLPSLFKEQADYAAGTTAGERLVSYVNDALRRAAQYCFWNDLTLVEERTLDADKVLECSESGKTDIDAVESIHLTEAQAINGTCPVVFYDTPGGWIVPGAAASGKVWVRLRPYSARFTRMEWSGETNYYANDLTYSAVTGKGYRSVKDQAGNDPDSDDGTNWEEVEFPQLFEGFVKLSVAAADAEFERKYEEAGRRDSAAKDELFRLKKSKGL